MFAWLRTPIPRRERCLLLNNRIFEAFAMLLLSLHKSAHPAKCNTLTTFRGRLSSSLKVLSLASDSSWPDTKKRQPSHAASARPLHRQFGNSLVACCLSDSRHLNRANSLQESFGKHSLFVEHCAQQVIPTYSMAVCSPNFEGKSSGLVRFRELRRRIPAPSHRLWRP